MGFENCFEEIAKELGRPLTNAEKDEFGQTAKDLTSKFKNSDDLEKALQDGYNSDATKAFQAKRNAALNAVAEKTLFENYKNNWADAPDKFWQSVAGRTNIEKPGALAGIGGQIGTTIDKYHQATDAAIQKEGLWNFVKTPENDRNVFLAKAYLDKGMDEGQLRQKYGDDAVKLAKIFNENGDFQKNNFNKAGGTVGDFSGYSFKHTYDPTRVTKFADEAAGDPANREAFVKELSDRLDWDKSFKENGLPVSEERRADVASNLFDAFRTGVHLKFGDEEAGGGGLDFGKALSQGRDLVFKSPEDEYEFYKKVTPTSNVTEAFYQQSRQMGRNEAIMKNFGPNAENTLNNLAQNIEDFHAKAGDRDSAAVSRDSFNQFMKVQWPTITGETSIPLTKGWFAGLSRGLRETMLMRYLGSVNFAQLGHSATAGLTEQRYGNNTFGDFFGGLAESLKGMAKGVQATRVGSALTGADFAEKSANLSEWARVQGFATEGMHNPVDVYSNEFDAPGRLSRTLKTMLNALFSYDIRNGAKAGAGKTLSGGLISNLENKFEDLPEGRQSLLSKFNVTPQEWEIARKANVGENPDWGKYYDPHTIGEGQEDAIKGEISRQRDAAGITKPVSDNDIGNFKNNLQDKFLNMFHEYASLATGEPTMQTRANLMMGTQPGTWTGEAVRAVGQLKSFSVNYLTNHLDAELRGYEPENLSLMEGIQKLFTHPSGKAVMGMTSAMTLVPMIGYMSHSLKQMTMMKMPVIPHDTESLLDTYMAGAAQSAGVGLYSDFLFGKKNRFGGNLASTALGPEAQFTNDLFDVFNKAFTKTEGYAFDNQKEEDKKLAPTALKFGLNYVPGVNAAYNNYYTHAALDYLLVNHLYETMDPGHLRRMERAIQSEQGQKMIVPPSDVWAGH